MSKNPNQQGRLYFAYGSNLSLAQMKERCPGAVPVQAYTLSGWRLVFVGERTRRWGQGGVASIVQADGENVPGAVYHLTPADEAALDGFEYVNHGDVEQGHYYREEALFELDGEPVLAYIATARFARQGEHPPSEPYRQTINQGRKDWGLPQLDTNEQQ